MLICTNHYSELANQVTWKKSHELWQQLAKKEGIRNRRLMRRRANLEVAIDLLARTLPKRFP
jgi:hypothetical protein